MSRFARFTIYLLLSLQSVSLWAEDSSSICELRGVNTEKLLHLISSEPPNRGDRAFAVLWDRNKSKVEAQISAQLKEYDLDASLRDELVAQTAQKALLLMRDRRFPNLIKDLGSVEGYLSLLASNRVRQFFVRLLATLTDYQLDASKSRDAQIVVLKALEKAELSEFSRALLEMNIVQAYGATQIAHYFALNEASVCSWIRADLKVLKQKLAEEGRSLAALKAAIRKGFSLRIAEEKTREKAAAAAKKKRIRNRPRKGPRVIVPSASSDAETLLELRNLVVGAYRDVDMTPRMKLVFRRRVFEGLSNAAVATELNASQENARQSFYDAIDKVVDHLKDERLTRPALLLLNFSGLQPALTPEELGDEDKGRARDVLRVDDIVQAIKDADLLPRMRKTVILRLFYGWDNQDVVNRFGLKVNAASASFTKSLEKVAELLVNKGITFDELKSRQYSLTRAQASDLFSGGRGVAGRLSPRVFRAHIEKAIGSGQLSSRQAEVARKYMFEGLSADEIKVQLALTGPQVSVAFADARLKISQYLEQYEISADDLSNVDFTLPEVEWNPMRYAIDPEDLMKKFGSQLEKFDALIGKAKLSPRTEIMLRLRVTYRWGFQNIAEALSMDVDKVRWYINMAVEQMSVDLHEAGFLVSQLKTEMGCFPYKAGLTSPIHIEKSLEELGSMDASLLNAELVWAKVEWAADAGRLATNRKKLLEQRILFNRSPDDLGREMGLLSTAVSAQVTKALTAIYPHLERAGISRELVVEYLRRDQPSDSLD